MNKVWLIFIFTTSISLSGCSENNKNTYDFTPTSSSSNDSNYIGSLSNTDFNILFIGNSLTYTNNLPGLVQKSAQLKGITLGVRAITLGNYAILNHWDDGEVQQQVASKKFDFVVLQQGPSSQSFGREVLIEYGKKYSDLCKTNDARLSFFMVWPSLSHYYTFEDVIKNHKDAASMNDAILCPVGEVWKEYFDTTGNFDYYGSDGFHPSLKGSQVAADVIVASLFEN